MCRGLVENSKISSERIADFSVIQRDHQGNLVDIVEKPDLEFVEQLPEPMLICMDCWRLGPTIFEACRTIGPSPRGEYEIPDAVMHTISEMGQTVRVVLFSSGVLDLSSCSDIGSVKSHLLFTEVRL